MFLIKAKGGLGNRVLSSASAILYADSTKRKWSIDWRDGVYAKQGVNAYRYLFSSNANTDLPNLNSSSVVVPSIWSEKLHESASCLIQLHYPNKHSNPFTYRYLSAPLNLKKEHGVVEVFWSYTSKYGRIKKFLSKSNRLPKDRALSQVISRYFQPCEDVTLAVNALMSGVKGKVLGVHIRYTDLKVPIEKILIKLDQCMKSGEYHSLFLATDNVDIEKKIVQKYSNVVVSNKRFNLSRQQLHDANSTDQKVDGAREALIDMVALSRCNSLMYCSRSTFAETSRLMGSFSKNELYDIDRYNLKIRLKRFLQEYL